MGGPSWNVDYSTRLTGYFEFIQDADQEAAIEAGVMLQDHDDWDCLEDLCCQGWVELVSSANRTVHMTAAGQEACAALRKHKVQGGKLSHFRYVADSI